MANSIKNPVVKEGDIISQQLKVNQLHHATKILGKNVFQRDYSMR